MNRRQFLAGLLGSTAVAVVPWKAAEASFDYLTSTDAWFLGCFTEDNLEAALIRVRGMRDAAGLRVMAGPARFIVPDDWYGYGVEPMEVYPIWGGAQDAIDAMEAAEVEANQSLPTGGDAKPSI